jgi:drug/metabolite transporter (DMT)-like permease
MSGARRFDQEEFPIEDFNQRRTNSSSSPHPHHSHHVGERHSRASRNSTGAKEELVVESMLNDLQRDARNGDHDINGESPLEEGKKDGKMLAISFVAMVFIGLGNKVFNKLMTIPMYNYPNFLNLLTSFVYIPVCFAYIIPMSYYGKIPEEQFAVPKKTFAVMGALDALAGIMQIFGATYLPGPLIILMLQAAIPVSMLISKYLIHAKYNKYQYAGALIVAGGILIVLGPSLTGGGNAIWAMVLILSTIPMALSSVYKEIALGETELDAMYLNGWVAVFQFLFSVVLAVPSSLASEPPVPIPDLPGNLYDGLKCYVGKKRTLSKKNSYLIISFY